MAKAPEAACLGDSPTPACGRAGDHRDSAGQIGQVVVLRAHL